MRDGDGRPAGGPTDRAGRCAHSLGALPVIFLGERLVAHPQAESGPFGEVLVAATLYAIAAVAATEQEPGCAYRSSRMPGSTSPSSAP